MNKCDGSYQCDADVHIYGCFNEPGSTYEPDYGTCLAHMQPQGPDGKCDTCRAYIAAGL